MKNQTKNNLLQKLNTIATDNLLISEENLTDEHHCFAFFNTLIQAGKGDWLLKQLQVHL